MIAPLTGDDEQEQLARQALVERVADRSAGQVLDVENVLEVGRLSLHQCLEDSLPASDERSSDRRLAQLFVHLVGLVFS